MINVELLKEKTSEKGLNLNRLAIAAGLDKSIVSRLFNGETKACTVSTAKKIASALNLTGEEASEIFFYDNVANQQL